MIENCLITYNKLLIMSWMLIFKTRINNSFEREKNLISIWNVIFRRQMILRRLRIFCIWLKTKKIYDKNFIRVIKIETIVIDVLIIVKSINLIDKIIIVMIIYRSTTFMFFNFNILSRHFFSIWNVLNKHDRHDRTISKKKFYFFTIEFISFSNRTIEISKSNFRVRCLIMKFLKHFRNVAMFEIVRFVRVVFFFRIVSNIIRNHNVIINFKTILYK